MINNTAIDVAIGLFFIYALYSLLVTTLTELLASLLEQRGKILKMGIKRMLDNDKPQNAINNNNNKILPENLSSMFLDKPEIKYLGKERKARSDRFPSYIKPSTFTNTLLDTLGFVYSNSTNLSSIKNNLDTNNETHKVLINLIDRADNNVNEFKILAEEWYNETMDRVSGWYKRRIQLITFITGVLIAFTLNVNTIEIAKILGKDEKSRIAMVEAASGYMSNLKTAGDSMKIASEKSFKEINTEVKDILKETNNINSVMSLTYPWQCNTVESVSWFSYIFGCLATAIALSLGSPFWFDLLSKLIKLRSIGTQEKTTNINSPTKPPVG